ncbi:putative protein Networked (NET), actin-binding (NAB) [Lupinus albus]|uniref:NAB domain-containing protein n=1 Tax=Lupinus albus TaxID=3870 RepID=A0A6A4PQS8_LUPAL|nr:putative protein Networked (NET), actin-binding (NAB) [Lupinus albus]
MLQRAATNAYSWWWVSPIRTNQSKWLEQNLQDMEERVGEALQIIDENGDSFAQRAEMYYRKRPELVTFVEEAFRAYRALAERYDHLSKELQSANRTIATVFPERVQYRIDDDDDESVRGTNSLSPDHNNLTRKPGIPKLPNISKKDHRNPSMLLTRKRSPKRIASSARCVPTTQSSGLSKVEGLAEIDKLQKEILAMQTEKEFVRSLYERSYYNYWEIEDQITGMQEKVCSLQDEFRIDTVIDDNDACAIMAATALNSCKHTLTKLQEFQARSSEEAKEAYERVKDAHERFETLRDNFIAKNASQQDQGTRIESKDIEEEMVVLEEEGHDVEQLREKIKEKLEEEDSGKSLTMIEMAELIDELVNKVVSLETSVSSQTCLVKRLRSETDELQTNIRSLEQDKVMLIGDSEKTNNKLKELEEELRRIEVIYQSVKRKESNLQTHFTEASCNLEHLSGKLNNVKLDEAGENSALYEKSNAPDGDEVLTDNLAIKISEEEKEDYAASPGNVRNEDNNSDLVQNIDSKSEKLVQQHNADLPDTSNKVEIESHNVGNGEEEDQPNWRQVFVSGIDDREKILLEEYTSVLRDYKDVKVKLNDVEKKNRDSIFDLALQVRGLKNDVATKDEEIQNLQQKLTYIETTPNENPFMALTEYKYTPQELDPEISSSNIEANAVQTSSADKQHRHVEITESIMSLGKVRLEKLRENLIDKRHSLSTLEKKFRAEIDGLLEENLEFWLRFSTSVHQIQKLQNYVQDLKGELRKIKENNKPEGNSNSSQSELKPIFRQLREIRTELALWLEHSAILQDELQGRHPSLCSLQDEIARAANPDSASEKAVLSGYQAAKFQGEVLYMKQENNKISSELQAGISFVNGLKNEVNKLLEELSQEIGVNNHGSGHDHVMKNSTSRLRIPLRSFLFGIKLKKQRQSMFSCTNPQLHRQNSDANDAPI